MILTLEFLLQLTDDITKCGRCVMSQGLSSAIGNVSQNEKKNMINVSTSKGVVGGLLLLFHLAKVR